MTQFAPPAPGYYPPPPPPPTPPTPPQYPAAPSYPSAPGQLPQQYAPQPGYAPQQYPGYPPVQLAPAPQPLAQGSIDEYYAQPSAGGGKSLSFPAIGTRYIGIVTRPITSGDIQQQTTPPANGSVPQFYKDGRPKFVMKVPLQLQPSPEFPDGLATWFVKGQGRDELSRAMAEAGAPAGPPEAGAIIDVSFVSTRNVPGMSPAKQMQVRYTRPGGNAPAQQAAPAPAVAQAPAQPAYDPAMAQAVGVVQQAFPGANEIPPAPMQQPQYAPPPVPQNVPPAQAAVVSQPIQPPAGLSPEQEALLAQLTAAQQG